MVNKTKRGKQRRTAPSTRRRSFILYVGLGALLLIAAGLTLAWWSGSQREAEAPIPPLGGPRLTVDKEEVDFGHVQVNKTVRASFRLTNAGDQPLRILGEPQIEVRQGC